MEDMAMTAADEFEQAQTWYVAYADGGHAISESEWDNGLTLASAAERAKQLTKQEAEETSARLKAISAPK